jgi:hypothetical protein
MTATAAVVVVATATVTAAVMSLRMLLLALLSVLCVWAATTCVFVLLVMWLVPRPVCCFRYC